MRGETKYPSRTFLTDGRTVIYLGMALEPDWTPMNNYGRKRTEYRFCKIHPSGREHEILMNDSVPGIWLQPGYQLDKFRKINKSLLCQGIVKELEL